MTASETKNKWMIFIIIATGTFMSLLSATSINVALPTIAKEFNASLISIQWVVTGYLLVISSILPVFGWAGDMLERKYVVMAGFFFFGLGGILCSFSTTLSTLIMSRFIQAIGASMNMANSYAAITTTFPQAQRGRALGMLGSSVALGSISGPAIGGFLLDWFSWSAIFYITIPFALLGLIGAYFYIPKNPPQYKKIKFDLLGAVFLIISISTLILALSQDPSSGLSFFHIALLILTSIISFMLFIYRESHYPTPLVDLSMFRDKVFLNGNLAGLCAFLALNSNNMLMPFYLHNVLGAPPKTMGMIMMIFPVMVIIVAPISGALSDKFGAPKFSITGMGLMTVAIVSLAITAQTMLFLPLVISLMIFGAANGMFQSPNNSTTLAVIPIEKHGSAGSIIALMRNFGAVVGTTISVRICDGVTNAQLASATTVTPEISKNAFISGYQAALLVGASFAFLGMLFSLNKKRNVSSQKKGIL